MSAHAVASDVGLASMSRQEFVQLRDLILREIGIDLPPIKSSLLVGRLARRLRALGLRSYGDYYRRLVAGDRDELVQMVDAICTNETHFFREPRHFEYITQQFLPVLIKQADQGRRPRRVRVWSAGCSTGEEPISLAMVLLAHCPPSLGWSVEILATDVSTRVLARASQSLWPVDKAREIPDVYLQRYMLRGVGDEHRGQMKACAELRQIIQYAKLNLHAPRWPGLGEFDLVLCRNVLIYFNAEGRMNVVHRLLDHLRPDGVLFIGHAESLSSLSTRVRCIEPTIYAPKPA
jgi:chemotaxis protein methyltransferase CheR